MNEGEIFSEEQRPFESFKNIIFMVVLWFTIELILFYVDNVTVPHPPTK